MLSVCSKRQSNVILLLSTPYSTRAHHTPTILSTLQSPICSSLSQCPERSFAIRCKSVLMPCFVLFHVCVCMSMIYGAQRCPPITQNRAVIKYCVCQ